MAPSSSCPIVSGGRLYLIRGNNILTCGDAENGEVVWQLRFFLRGVSHVFKVSGEAQNDAAQSLADKTQLARESVYRKSFSKQGKLCLDYAAFLSD